MKRLTFMIIIHWACIHVNLMEAQAGEREQDLQEISLDSLLKIQVSTAAKYSQYASDAPASITIVSADDIQRYGYRTLDEVLMSVRGFYTSNDRHYVYLGVRGFARPTDYNNRVLLLLNGHTTNENFYGSAAVGTDLALDFNIVDRIEIVRGPGSALYGTGAMFTVINIITKSGEAINGARFSVETGSYGLRQGTAAIGKRARNGIDWTLSGKWTETQGQDLYFQEYDDPATNYGIADHLDWERYYGLLTTISYKKLSLQGFESFREYGMPTGAWEMIFNDKVAKAFDETSFIEGKYESNIGLDKSFHARAYLDRYRYGGDYPYEEAAEHDANIGKWFGGEFQFCWDLRAGNRLTCGVEYQNNYQVEYRQWDEFETYFDGSFPFYLYSFYLQDELQLTENLSFTVGARQDDYSTAGRSVTPRAAIIYNPFKGSTLKLLFGGAFRAANAYEVHYEDVGIAKANPWLKPEKMRTAEVIWEQRLHDNLYGIISLYSYGMRNLIDSVVDPTDSLTQFRNVSRAKAKGVEMELNAELPLGVRAYGNYSYQDTQDGVTSQKLTNSPSHILKGGLALHMLRRMHAALELLYESERKTVFGTRTAPYLLVNANIYTSNLWNRVRFSMKIFNLFDVAYSTPGGYEYRQRSFRQNGRNYSIRLDYGF